MRWDAPEGTVEREGEGEEVSPRTRGAGVSPALDWEGLEGRAWERGFWGWLDDGGPGSPVERPAKFAKRSSSRDEGEMLWESVAGEADGWVEGLSDFSYLESMGPWGMLDDELEVERLRPGSPVERQGRDFARQEDGGMQWESVADEPDHQGEALPGFSYLASTGPWGMLDDELEVARLRPHSPVFAWRDAQVDFEAWFEGMVDDL